MITNLKIISFFKIFIVLYFVLQTTIAMAVDYQNDFVFVNKSYNRDVYRSVNLFKTFAKYYKDQDNFYVVVPQKDLELFEKEFHKALEKKEFTKLPIFLTDELVLKDCKENVDEVMKMLGWVEQQVIKMCFSQTKLGKHYVTLDSDLSFKKNFDKSSFYTEDNNLRMVLREVSTVGEEALYNPSIEIAKLLNVRNSYQDFVSGYATWDSNILNQLLLHAKNTDNDIGSFSKMLAKVGYEMQWYGMYINEFLPQTMFPFDKDFIVIYGAKGSCLRYRMRKYYLKTYDNVVGTICGNSNSLTIEEYCRFRLIG